MAGKHSEHSPAGAACAHATSRSEGAVDALARAEALCRRQGARLTPIRRQVLEALYATHHPLGAYEIAAAIGARGRRLAPITIYRALDFLMEQGLAHRLASRNAFIACPHGHEPRELVAFLICERCSGVDELSSPGLAQTLSQLLGKERFQPHFQMLEITGLCAHCRDSQGERLDGQASRFS